MLITFEFDDISTRRPKDHEWLAVLAENGARYSSSGPRWCIALERAFESRDRVLRGLPPNPARVSLPPGEPPHRNFLRRPDAA